MQELDFKWVYRHDIWNIIALPFVVYINWRFILEQNDMNRNLMFHGFLFYIVADSFWIIFKPKCVGSPRTILIHHIVTTCGWYVQSMDKDLAYFSALALMVEANTWLKITKRYTEAYETLNYIFDIIFYITWFLLRVTMYPYLVYATGIYTIERSYSCGTIFNVALPTCITAVLLMCMNMKWTYDLFMRNGYLGVKVRNTNGKIEAMQTQHINGNQVQSKEDAMKSKFL